MMYGFMTLNDGTEINHSEAKIVDGKEVVKVYIERPVMNGFDSAECYLPTYEWTNVVGFVNSAHSATLARTFSHCVTGL